MRVGSLRWLLCAGHVATAVATFIEGTLPADASLRVTLADGSTVSAAAGTALTLSAGETVVTVTVVLPGGEFFNVQGAKLKVVKNSTTKADAWAGSCFPGNAAEVGPATVDSPMYLSDGASCHDARGLAELNTVTLSPAVAFRRGGAFRLCYSDDGTFRGRSVGSSIGGHADVVDVTIIVRGVTTSCTGLDCLDNRPIRCYSRLGERGALGACGVPMENITGQMGKLSWSPAHVASWYGGNGLILELTAPPCGGVPNANAFCAGGAACSGTDLSVPVLSSSYVELSATLPLQLGSESKTVSACYCSGVRGCGVYSNYVQQIGILHLFVATVTPPTEPMCTSTRWGVLAEMFFVVCVRCPPGSCPAFGSTESRLRIAENLRGVPEVPSWSAGHRCHTARSTRHLVEPRMANPNASANVSKDYGAANGGTRSDFKRFQPTGALGYTLPTWQVFEPPGSELDLCMCLSACHQNSSWFKVGQLDVFATKLTSFASTSGPNGANTVVPFEVGRPGQLAMDASLLPYDNANIYGLNAGGGVMLTRFDPLTDNVSTDACLRNTSVDVKGLTFSNVAAYTGTMREQRLVFDGGVLGRTLTVQTSSLLAACYCPVLSSGVKNGCESGSWMGLGLLVVSGPRADQYWVLPTFQTTRFEYHGIGVRSTDSIVLVDGDSVFTECGPNTPILNMCPNWFTDPILGHEICASDAPFPITRYANYSTMTLSESTVGCDEQNANCRSSYIKGISTSSDGVTLHFANSTSTPGGLGDLGLAEGDTIELDSGVACGKSCIEEMLQRVMGTVRYSGLQAILHVSASTNFDVNQPAAVLPTRTFDASLPWSILLRVKPEHAGWKSLVRLANQDPALTEGELEIGLAGSPLPANTVFVQQAGNFMGNTTVMSAAKVFETHWNHIAVVYTGTVSGRLNIYINGTLTNYYGNIRIAPTFLPLTCGGSIQRGSYVDAPGYLNLEDIRWYNTPLSIGEVVQEMNKNASSVSLLGSSAPLGNPIHPGPDAKTFKLHGLRWDPPPEIKVSSDGVPWRRTNRGVTKAEVFTTVQRTVRVCWIRDGNYIQAGKIRFKHPERLKKVGVHFTTSEWNRYAPFIVTFKTNDATTIVGQRYAAAKGSMSLELVLVDTDKFDIVQSVYDGEYLPMQPTSSYSEETATQTMCGILFREMWSDDPSGGFPLPKSCYFFRLSPNMRKVVVVFDARNGLRGGVTYQLVMNGVGYPMFDINRQAMLITTLDDRDAQRYSGLEFGKAYGSKVFKLGAGKNDPQFAGDDGLVLVGGDETTNLYEVPEANSPEPIFKLRIKGASFMTGKIKRESLLRLWLWPLTAWDISPNCADLTRVQASAFKVHCTTFFGKFRRCGFVSKCGGKAVVYNGPQTNTIQVQMPSMMNDLWGSIQYEMKFYGVNRPKSGLAPTRIGAEISKPDDTKPNYYIAKGPFIHKAPNIGFLLARLLTDGKDDVPFQGMPTHLLYMLISMPQDIRGYWDWAAPGGPSIRSTSYFEVTAPEHFSCLNISAVPADGLGLRLYTSDGDAISGLADVSMTAPTGFGTPNLAGWQARLPGRPRVCRYTLLDKQLIPRRTSLVIGIRVMPTNGSLPVSDPANLWTVTMTTPGEHNLESARQTYSAGFYRTGAAGVPVLGQLSDSFIQPGNFSLSSVDEVVYQNLSVFFRTEDNNTVGGFVDVEAPESFHFDDCIAADLADTYYASGADMELHRLPIIKGCSGMYKKDDKTIRPKNVARIALDGPLAAGSLYAFSVSVRNPTFADMRQYVSTQGWGLRTRDMYGVGVCSTKALTPKGFPGSSTSWELRNGSLHTFASLQEADESLGPGVAIELSSTLPYNLTGEYALATVLFTLPEDFDGTLSVTAPGGYSWVAQPANFDKTAHHGQAYMSSSVGELCPSGQDVTTAESCQRAAALLGKPWVGAYYSVGQHKFCYSLGQSVYFNTAAALAGTMPSSTFSSLCFKAMFPADLSVLGHLQTLVFNQALFQGGVRYGFTIPVAVPYFSTTTSVHSYFVEFRIQPMPWNGDNGFGIGAAVPAMPVRAISHSLIRSTNRLPGAFGDLLIRVRLTTKVHSPGALRLLLPPGYDVVTVNGTCDHQPWPGQPPWPSDSPVGNAMCSFADEVLLIRPVLLGLPAELLEFRITAKNPFEDTFRHWHSYHNTTLVRKNIPYPWPSSSCGPSPCWIIDTNSDCNATFCSGSTIDSPQIVEGVSVGFGMVAGGISGFRPAGRLDRPGEQNFITFYFRLSDGNDKVPLPLRLPFSSFNIIGPVGFVFEGRCLSLVEIRVATIFSSHQVAKAYWGIDDWPSEAEMISCTGTANLVTMEVGQGLNPYRTYAFTIGVTNPWSLPVENTWSLSYQGRVSPPFQSFDLWTFYKVSLVPLSEHAGADCYDDGTCVGAGQGVAVPMKLRFQVLNVINSGGELRITAPHGFGFSPVVPWPTDGQIERDDVATHCIVRQYEDANYTFEPTTWRLKDRTCLIASRGSTIDGSGTGDHRTFRMTLDFEFNEVDPRPPKSLHPSNAYELIIFVDPPAGFRPASNWDLETYGVGGALIDQGYATGFDVMPVFKKFEHSNAGMDLIRNEISKINVEGLSFLEDFVFDFQLSDVGRNGDTIVFIAPPTFRMQLTPSTECVRVVVLGPQRALTPENSSASVTCDGATLRVLLTNITGSIQTWDLVRFRIYISNPEAPSPLDLNYWRVEHRSRAGDGLKSAAMIPSWHVIPRLAYPAMLLTGIIKAADSVTTILLSFRTVQPAVEVLIEALHPHTFDFTKSFARATVGTRDSVPQLLAAEENRLYLGTAMQWFQNVTITITFVRLPTASGFSSWRVTTYKLSEIYGAPPILNDEAYFAGFWVPGRLQVPSTTAITGKISAALLGKKTSVATFHLRVPSDLLPNDELHVQIEGAGSEGFELAPRINSQVGRKPDAQLLTSSLQNLGQVSVSTTGEGISGMTECTGAPPEQDAQNMSEPIRRFLVRVDEFVAANQHIQLRLTLTTPPNRVVLKQERWRFEVWRKGNESAFTGVCEAVLVATNDAGPVPLPVVTQLPSPTPKVPHRPPLTVIPVEFVLNPLDTNAAAFVVRAPNGFTFPTNCLGAGSPPVRCAALPARAGRARARLTCNTGGTECMRGLSTFILVLTPRVAPINPKDNIWFVEAVFLNAQGDAAEQLGRGEFTGFGLVDMTAEISYAPMAGIPVDVAVTFKPRVSLPAGTQVYILAPRGLRRFGCGNGIVGYLNPLSLGLLRACSDTRPSAENPSLSWSVTLVLNGTLEAGDHVITIPAETPLTTPTAGNNIFEIYVRNPAGNNADVSLQLPGEGLYVGFRMIAWPLWWEQVTGYQGECMVSVPLEILDDSNVAVNMILITLPMQPNMNHTVRSAADVQISMGKNRHLPVTGVIIPDSNSILLQLDDSVLLYAGLYAIRFKVEVPRERPQLDIWRVAICGLGANTSTCFLNGVARSGRGPAIKAVWALPGFDAVKAPSGSLLLPMAVGQASSAHPGWRLPSAVVGLFLIALAALRA